MIKECLIQRLQRNYGNISTKTVERAKKVAMEELTALFFGIDGIKI